MGAKIYDEFALSGMARQQAYMLRRQRDGLCVRCGTRPLLTRHFCADCREKRNAQIRLRRALEALKR